MTQNSNDLPDVDNVEQGNPEPFANEYFNTDSIPSRLTNEELLVNEDQAAGLQRVTDADEVATVVYNWLGQKVAAMNHVINAPEEEFIAIKVPDPEHPDADADGFVVLTGAERKRFLNGVKWALEQLEDFPYKFLPEDADGNVSPGYESQARPEDQPEAN